MDRQQEIYDDFLVKLGRKRDQHVQAGRKPAAWHAAAEELAAVTLDSARYSVYVQRELDDDRKAELQVKLDQLVNRREQLKGEVEQLEKALRS